jgi:hypothetical protein
LCFLVKLAHPPESCHWSRTNGAGVKWSRPDEKKHPDEQHKKEEKPPQERPGVQTMSFGLYAIGFVILIGGLAYGAHLAHVPSHWIVVGAIVLLGLGIVTGVMATRQKDPPK